MSQYGQFGPRLLDSANPETQVKAAEEICTATLIANDPQHAMRKKYSSDGTVPALTKALGDTTNDRVREPACVRAGSKKVITAVLETTKDDRVREQVCGPSLIRQAQIRV